MQEKGKKKIRNFVHLTMKKGIIFTSPTEIMEDEDWDNNKLYSFL